MERVPKGQVRAIFIMKNKEILTFILPLTNLMGGDLRFPLRKGEEKLIVSCPKG